MADDRVSLRTQGELERQKSDEVDVIGCLVFRVISGKPYTRRRMDFHTVRISYVALPTEILGGGRACRGSYWADPRFSDSDGEFGTLTQHDRQDALTTDVTIRSRAVRPLECLEAVPGLREQPDRDVAGYQRGSPRSPLNSMMYSPMTLRKRRGSGNSCAGTWRAWVPHARTAPRARKLHEELYDLRPRIRSESAHIELVWGHGILSRTVERQLAYTCNT
jgi:hypothetical protein